MKSQIRKIITGIVFAGLAVGLWSSFSSRSLFPETLPAYDPEIMVATESISVKSPKIEMEDMPVYPGAQVLDSTCLDEMPTSCRGTYEVPDSVEQVVAYYKQNLLRAGWKVTAEFSRDYRISRTLDFVWTHDGLDAPTRRWITLMMDFNESSTKTTILSSYERWPDPRRVPRYPSAKQIEVRWEPSPDYPPEQVTTFVTAAEPSMVREYYVKALSDHGWQTRMNNTDSGNNGQIEFTFSYFRGGLGPNLGSYGNVYIQSQDGKQTRVELRIRGVGEDAFSTSEAIMP